MIRRVLVANRGEIACRIIRTLRRLGIESIAVYSEADAQALHVALADAAVCIGPPAVKESYLAVDHLLAVARDQDADAVHPGYGLLSENADFAASCEGRGLAFIGPTPEQIRRFGLKHEARLLAAEAGVPLLPGSGILADLAHARAEADRVGFPVMLKSTAGGGGIGMALCADDAALRTAFPAVERLSRGNFSDGGLFVERYVEAARHIEVQIFGDGRGTVAALGERDCSLQRRNQKVVEETPAPGLADALRSQLSAAAVRLAESVLYRSAGTVEFVFDVARGEAYFLEVNTRLQVEHGVTEAVTGIDLVEWMVRLAAGETLPLAGHRHEPRGHAIEVRLYAEDPNQDFQPCAGVLTDVVFPPEVRVDGWIERGSEVTPYYDPLLAKLIVAGRTREEAVAHMAAALAETRLAGIETNLDYLRAVVRTDVFRAGTQTTRYLRDFSYAPSTIDVRDPGTHTTVQDHPGRLGYWAVGVPPSGAMDTLAFRFANRVVGNPAAAAGLECTVAGPTLRFNRATIVCLTGAAMAADLDGTPVPFWTPVAVPAGATLRLGTIAGGGLRTFVAIRGGLDVPDYLGSKSTFTLGRFGGHAGRCLRTGDVLHLASEADSAPLSAPAALPDALRPVYGDTWTIGVLYGPHGAPDFFTAADVETLLSTAYEVHYNSSRTGVRLIGPKPEWARSDGGEAGLHPSNIHDNGYAVGTLDFTGDMPIILGPDGPSLGGFVCPLTIARAELWKVGQLRPGDAVRFVLVSFAEAAQRLTAQEREIATMQSSARATAPVLAVAGAGSSTVEVPASAVLHRLPAAPGGVAVAYRPCGDHALLVEYGPPVLDLRLRFRVHALMTWLEAARIAGVVDLTPGIRSLHIQVDGRVLPLARLLEIVTAAERELPAVDEMEVPTRIVHLPLSWEDDATLLAIRKYMQIVRKDAPWCPSNIEFIRRINGLESVEQVREIVFDASYLVLGLGDVYLGAPVATPVDPRHRLVTTKYNPARTWTPENAVGIGGAYLCIYGMEGPGGYQFVGRTVPVWNRFKETSDFAAGRPWLLRFFDQIRFYPMGHDELLRYRADFLQGKVRLEVHAETFRLRDYQAFLAEHREGIGTFKVRQQAAFEAERERWAALPEFVEESAARVAEEETRAIPPGAQIVAAHVPGNVWQVVVQAGASVAAGDVIVMLESMKMEIAIKAPVDGEVLEVTCVEGRPVAAGDPICVFRAGTVATRG